jgi:hypothetical protein
MSPDPYTDFDPVLEPWATARGLSLVKLYRDDVVRSVWLYSMKNPGQSGQEPQLWLGWPTADGRVEVHIAVGEWSHAAQAKIETLAAVLDRELELLKSRCIPTPGYDAYKR